MEFVILSSLAAAATAVAAYLSLPGKKSIYEKLRIEPDFNDCIKIKNSFVGEHINDPDYHPILKNFNVNTDKTASVRVVFPPESIDTNIKSFQCFDDNTKTINCVCTNIQNKKIDPLSQIEQIQKEFNDKKLDEYSLESLKNNLFEYDELGNIFGVNNSDLVLDEIYNQAFANRLIDTTKELLEEIPNWTNDADKLAEQLSELTANKDNEIKKYKETSLNNLYKFSLYNIS